MDSTLPVAVPPAYKIRRGWLIAFGIIEILMGCSFLLMILFMAFAFLGPAAAKMPAMPPGALSRPALLILVSLQYGIMAAIFFAAGVGSIRCKNWARILMLVVSGLWLALGLLSTLVMVFMVPIIMRQQPAKVTPGIQHAIVVGIAAFTIAFGVLLPGIFLLFYSRKSVKATCHAVSGTPVATGEGTPARGLPVPLAILGVWQAFGAFTALFVLFRPVFLLFGFVVRGAPAVLVMLAFSAVSGYAAWAVFKQKLIGWQIALAYTLIGMLNILVTYLRKPDMLPLFREMGYNDQTLSLITQLPHFLSAMWLGSIVLFTALLVFLLYTRKFFPTEPPRNLV